MKYLFAVPLFILIAMSFAYGGENFEDVVYLKNGNIIRGMIIEQQIGKTVKIQTRDRNVFLFAVDEIEKITKEPLPEEILVEPKMAPTLDRHSSSRNRYYGILRIGFRNGEDHTLFNANFIDGAKFGNYFSSGFGFGYDNYPNGGMLPIFLDLRGYFLTKPIVPSIYLDVGYSLAWVENENGVNWGGFMLATGAGIQVPISGDFSVLANVGYKMQKAKERWYYGGYWYYWDEKRTVTYDFFTVDFGITF